MTQDLEQILIEIVKEAGRFLRKNAFNYGDIEWKKEDDPVTVLDKRTEEMIRERILDHIPANFIGEEYGFDDNGAEYTFIIDPIDGTKSFIRREFLSATSIGVERNGELMGGIVYDFMKDVMYVGWEDDSYILQADTKYPLHQPNQFRKVKISLDGQDVPDFPLYGIDGISVKHRTGSIALNMAQLASGTFEGYIIHTQGKGAVWDIAGGYYLLNQRGYHMTDIDGNPFDYRNDSNGLIALDPKVKDRILPLLQKKSG